MDRNIHANSNSDTDSNGNEDTDSYEHRNTNICCSLGRALHANTGPT
jgi:hypothetical protein